MDKDKAIFSLFANELKWNVSRAKCGSQIIKALIKLQTVNFNKLALAFDTRAKISSNERRVQRFFSGHRFCLDSISKLIFKMVYSGSPLRLAIDRTNWKFGRQNINILMLSICMDNIAVPLMWTMLDKKGNSNQNERKALVDRYIRLFGAASIESILADREFIGEKWVKLLIDSGVNFYIRLRANMYACVPGKKKTTLKKLFNHLPVNHFQHLPMLVYIDGNMVHLSGGKIRGSDGKEDYLIIASLRYDDRANITYADRWQVETLFKALKSSGFRVESTHLKDLDRVGRLLCMLAIAFTWAYKVGEYINKKISPIRLKRFSNGARRASSVFRYGLNELARMLLNPYGTSNEDRWFSFLSGT